MRSVFFNANPYGDTDNVYRRAKEILYGAGYEETKEGKNAELAVSIGGDGTFLDTARLAPNAEIIGINKGTLGYLAEFNPNDIAYVMKHYIEGNYIVEKRMMAECKFILLNGLLSTEHHRIALNDVIISKRNSSVIDLSISVDGNTLARYYADGIIISTPTGSTGYAFSCGAPIISPTSDMLIITPIAPHTVMNRSICVSSDSKIKVTVTSARNDDCCKVSIDGCDYEVPVGTSIDVAKSEKHVKLVKLSDSISFIEKVMSKMCGI